MRFHSLIIFLLFSISQISIAQLNDEAQELLEMIEEEENDTLKVDLYTELGKELRLSDTSIYNKYHSIAIDLANRIDYEKGQIDLLYRRANNWHYNVKDINRDSLLLTTADLWYDSVYNMSVKINYDFGKSCGLNGLGRTQVLLGDYDSAIAFHLKDLELCQSKQDTEGIRISSGNLAYCYSQTKHYDKSIYYSELEIQNCDENQLNDIISAKKRIAMNYQSIGDYKNMQAQLGFLEGLIDQGEISDPNQISELYYDLGEAFYMIGNYSGAVDFLEKSLHFGKGQKSNQTIIWAMIQLGELHLSQKNYAEALTHFNKSISMNKMEKDVWAMGFACYMAGKAHILSGNLDSAHYYFNKIKSHKDVTKYDVEGHLLIFNAKLKLVGGQIDSAYYIVNKALNLVKDRHEEYQEFYEAFNILGDILFQRKEFEQAIETYGKVLDLGQKLYTPYYQLESLEGISNCYREIGDYKNEAKYYRLFYQLEDSLQNQYNSQRLAKLEFDSFREKQEAEHQAQLAKEERTRTIIIVSTGLLLVILIILYFFYRSKAKANKKLSALNSEINYQKEELEFLNQEKNKLIGVVAHDLRSPLNSVKGLVNIYKIEDDENEKERYLDLISVSTERMTDMVNRVLDVSALESKKLDLRSEKVDLVELMNQLMLNFQINAEKKNQSIKLDTKLEQAHVELDKNYLIQVIENLASNALKYSEKETTTTISIESVQNKIRLSVIDQGPGISKEEQKKLFKEFSTLTTRTTGGEKATGLGLSIVKKYVEAMKGRIWCESVLGEGSAFKIEFALAVA